MKIVIIGFGSIGRRHAMVLKKNFKSCKLFICTKQKIKKHKCFKDLAQIKLIKPDYVIIASETHKHLGQLKFLEKNFSKLKILVEKPLFKEFTNLKIKKNSVFVGYNLRFHPFIVDLLNVLKRNEILDAQFITNSFLPEWRKNIPYKNNYAAHQSKGGGVILDLSHDLDLIHFFFKNIKIKFVSFGKKSKLNLQTEDNLKFFATSNKTQISLDLKYYSRNKLRLILIDGHKFSIKVDLVKNTYIITNRSNRKIIKKNYDTNFSYLQMHKAIIFEKNSKFLCSYSEGLKVLQTIKKIKLKK